MKMRSLIFSSVLLLVLAGSHAGNRNTYPLPEDRGTAAKLKILEKLPVYIRVVETTAHPDDESAGTLTWLSRNYHAQTALFCLTRGEGGQNILGSEKYQELGLLRTGELLEACKFYGVDLYFGNVMDFGFSKTAEETLSKWNHGETLGEMVRFIRRYRPDIVISRFQGNAQDGHGHHQAAGILTQEAFRAASDPKSYPDQLQSGLAPWRPKKLYVSSPFFGAGSPDGSMPPWTVRVPAGDYDPVLGRSYREIGVEGYSKHRTQGNGAIFAQPGTAYEYFKLIESSVGMKQKENSFFDSIDTSLQGIYELAGGEKPILAFLQTDLSAIEQEAKRALHSFDPVSPEKSAPAVYNGMILLNRATARVKGSSASLAVKELILDALRSKTEDFQNALSAVLGLYFEATCQEMFGTPGQEQPITVSFYNRGSESVVLKNVRVQASGNVKRAGNQAEFGTVAPKAAAVLKYAVDLYPGSKPSEQYWQLENSTDARYRIKEKSDEFAPFGRPEITVEGTYAFKDLEVPIRTAAKAQAGNSIRGSDFEEFQIVPEISVTIDPDLQIVPLSAQKSVRQFRVSITNNSRDGVITGKLKIRSGENWRISPPVVEYKLSRKSETYSTAFTAEIPASARKGFYRIQAVATNRSHEFDRGFHVVTYPENWSRNYYLLAETKVERFDLKLAPNLMIGYIQGAGDDIPAAIERLGIKVQMLSPSDLASGDLRRYSAIITGIRAYNVNGDLRANNKRLMDYVARGGTLIVQYVRPDGRPAPGQSGSPFPYGPYPMNVSESDRITVEDSPVRILDLQHPIFRSPNRITEADFEGWIQERGLYFMSSWDGRYKALLSGNDPGESAKSGGMLYARYGKGHYIYTAYSWFRQLPAGIPGAFRLFANMLSLGRPVG